jgi:hypothetical protein
MISKQSLIAFALLLASAISQGMVPRRARTPMNARQSRSMQQRSYVERVNVLLGHIKPGEYYRPDSVRHPLKDLEPEKPEGHWENIPFKYRLFCFWSQN